MTIDILAYELKYKGDEMVMALLDEYKAEIGYTNRRVVAKSRSKEGDDE